MLQLKFFFVSEQMRWHAYAANLKAEMVMYMGMLHSIELILLAKRLPLTTQKIIQLNLETLTKKDFIKTLQIYVDAIAERDIHEPRSLSIRCQKNAVFHLLCVLCDMPRTTQWRFGSMHDVAFVLMRKMNELHKLERGRRRVVLGKFIDIWATLFPGAIAK